MSAAATAAAAAPDPNPTTKPLVAGDWTVVRSRRRRTTTPTHPHPQTLTLVVTPSPWCPSDSSVDPSRVSRLLSRMHAAISRLASSRFYRRLLSPLRLRRHLSLLGTGAGAASGLHLVVYGVGSFEHSLPSRLQLALAVLLRRDLPGAAGAPAEVFDPVLSAAECAVAAALGLAVSPVDEGCRRRAAAPTLFYMPHCEAALYDALLAANWHSPAQLRRVAVLGNSFGHYARQAEGASPAAGVAAGAAHVFAARRYAWEIGIDDDSDGGGLDGDGFFRAFNETSWHFFELGDNVDLGAAVAHTGR